MGRASRRRRHRRFVNMLAKIGRVIGPPSDSPQFMAAEVEDMDRIEFRFKGSVALVTEALTALDIRDMASRSVYEGD